MKTSTYYILLALAVLFCFIETADACSLNPTAVITTEPDGTVFYNGDPVLLSGENSTANCGSINQYRWRVRPVGGSYTTIYQGSSPTYNYTFPLLNDGESEKSYDIELRVRNSSGLFGYAYKSITVKHSHESFYYLTDHLRSVRVTVDERGDPVGWDDYYPFGLRMPGRSQTQHSSPLTDVKFTGYELNQEGQLGIYHAGARLYDPAVGRFMQQDPLTGMYPGWSPYNYVLGNPLLYVDPDGRYVIVQRNDDETYTVIGGHLDDDRGIYLDDGEGGKGEMIGRSITTHSFFSDEGEVVEGAIIDMVSTEGQEFLDELIGDNPDKITYFVNARYEHYYDFKARGQGDKYGEALERHHYRGSVLSGGAIASARDVGNIGAGMVAGRQGLNWASTRFLFDGYEMFKDIRSMRFPRRESPTTRKAQRLGYDFGVRLRSYRNR